MLFGSLTFSWEPACHSSCLGMAPILCAVRIQMDGTFATGGVYFKPLASAFGSDCTTQRACRVSAGKKTARGIATTFKEIVTQSRTDDD